MTVVGEIVVHVVIYGDKRLTQSEKNRKYHKDDGYHHRMVYDLAVKSFHSLFTLQLAAASTARWIPKDALSRTWSAHLPTITQSEPEAYSSTSLLCILKRAWGKS